MEEKRSSFTGKIGFVLAAAGSAVGLGNIWRFPYLAARHGGGIFLLVYIILSVTFGFSLMLAEIAIGRKTGLSAIGAFQKLNKKFSFIGYLGAVIPAIILPYYCVIGGWVTKYCAVFISGRGAGASANDYFSSFISGTWEPIGWFFLFLAITSLVVLLGVEKGIEKVSKIMMPVLIALSVFIAIYVCFLPGAGEGLKYYFIPDFSRFSIMTVVAAMQQLFYSMSIAMGIMITYGSYMKKDVSIETSVHQIEIFDTGIAFLAGMMIVPAVGAFNPTYIKGDAADKLAGPSLMFETLPKVFDSMFGGQIIGAVFFLLVFFAALTSSISLMETVVSIVCDKFKWERKLTCLVVFIASIALGLPSVLGSSVWAEFKILGMQMLDMFDFISNGVLMPVTALLTCIFVGYIIKPKTVIEEVELSGKFRLKILFNVMIKYIAPVFLFVILAFSLAEKTGIGRQFIAFLEGDAEFATVAATFKQMFTKQ